MTDILNDVSRRLLLAAGVAAISTLCCPGGVAVADSRSDMSSMLPSRARRVDDPPADDRAAPERHVHAGPKAMALTFDDGPSDVYTPQVLSILRQHGVTATFFMVGKHADLYPDTVRAVAAEGHLIGNHTWSHRNFKKLSAAEIRGEIERASERIDRILGVPPTLFRAPYGHFTPTCMDICRDLGLRPVSWSVDPEDWSDPGAGVISERVLSEARTGSIILNHDGYSDRSQTVSALRAYLPRLIKSGYRFVLPDRAS
ncbi:polysaccharide deacetylase family protein [Streptomyces flavofungini]|uniref:Polysaccharide deacetylase family protein n=1 Tax=Streptomyces flavofungini TaxID=68200 RepID=A0ABS0XJD1_9ACTN|nr:polysaccharide deacetylase family protein [Streptomyces flavofungini]MBJ3813302.1 polysaccharide deacetylase family protein [Streptomyces flavofungini]